MVATFPAEMAKESKCIVCSSHFASLAKKSCVDLLVCAVQGPWGPYRTQLVT